MDSCDIDFPRELSNCVKELLALEGSIEFERVDPRAECLGDVSLGFHFPQCRLGPWAGVMPKAVEDLQQITSSVTLLTE